MLGVGVTEISVQITGFIGHLRYVASTHILLFIRAYLHVNLQVVAVTACRNPWGCWQGEQELLIPKLLGIGLESYLRGPRWYVAGFN